MTDLVFQKVILMGRPGVKRVPETLDTLRDYLHHLNIEMAVEEQTASMMKDKKLPQLSYKDSLSAFQLMIVVGGDGSLLHAAHLALPYNLPVLGINRGRLGFLTDIHPEDLQKVGEVLHGQYQEESRFLLKAQLFHNKKLLYQDIALNDVVLLPGDIPQMIEFEIYIDKDFVCSQRADGMIVATPTGSTAYALSGGGPILHSQLNAVVLVPMFPHTLSSRPIVINANSDIMIVISKTNEVSPHVSCDGQNRVSIAPGGYILIRKKSPSLRLIHPRDYSYFATLREKLGWEQHTTQRF